MSKRILVVEDHADNRQIIRDMLAPTGYEITEAENGEEALAAIAKQRPDLILMDIQLPTMDGYEATRRIKADPALRSIPIIAVTSYALSGRKRRHDPQAVTSMCPNHLVHANCWRKFGSTCPNKCDRLLTLHVHRELLWLRSLMSELARAFFAGRNFWVNCEIDSLATISPILNRQ
jgi:two-component system cell cycle response regulator DivK